MRLIVDLSLAGGFILINAPQQRASLPFKPGVLERKVYNNDDITFFSVLTFARMFYPLNVSLQFTNSMALLHSLHVFGHFQ